ncbi:MAG: glycosyltransferase [Alphaproteobacteria bacterium]|nr:glycosyltransferase [Alphaproteobacteria bacterium]
MNRWINIACVWIPIPSIRRRFRVALYHRWFDRQNNPNVLLNNNTDKKPYILWFDHALGGGTETYSKRQFNKLQNKFEILRIQYRPRNKRFHITRVQNKNHLYTTAQATDIQQFAHQINIDKIVVNNLVGYPNALDILHIIKNIAATQYIRPHISVRGHDFQSICPSFNLINCDGAYCKLNYKTGCENCWKRKIMATNPTANATLKSGATSIKIWQQNWRNFLEQSADEIVVFSDAIKDIFVTAYPNIKNKIVVIPHETQNLRHVKIPKHKKINLAVLGNISWQKGANVIREMAQHIDKNINIIIIGNMRPAPKNIRIYGRYKTDDLPRIMEKQKIDAVFIPSVWPETFSYTTSEAMSMGLPVICFDMGAPAERVKHYAKGLVLKTINPPENLNEIIEFIARQKL